MDGDHALKLCDIFHYNRFLFGFLSYSSFSSDGHKPLGWFYFVIWNSFPSDLGSYPLCRVYYWEKNIMQMAGTDVLNGQAPRQTAMTFSSAAFMADKFCCIHRADRKGIWGLQADPSLLHGEESHMGLRLEKGGRRKESLRAFLTTALHVTLHQCGLRLCLAKKIWAVPSLSLQTQEACAAFPLNPVHTVNIFSSLKSQSFCC